MEDEDWEKELEMEEEKEKKQKAEEDEKKKKKKEEEKKKKEEEEKKKEEEEKKKKEEEKKKKKDNNKIEDKKDNKNTDLKIEKDYVELAKKNATKIKDAKPLPIFTLAYLQNIIELLGPTLEINQINELLKTSNSIFNKKLNEGEKKKVSTKANIKVGKINDRNDKIGDYGHIDDEEEEEEEEEEEINDPDKYI